MRKVILFMFCTVSICTARAQFSRKSQFVQTGITLEGGGGAGVYVPGLGLGYGRAIAKNTFLVVDGSYFQNTNKFGHFRSDFGMGIGVKRFFPISGKFSLTASGSLRYFRSKMNFSGDVYIDSSFTRFTENYTSDALEVQLQAGISFMASKKLQFELTGSPLISFGYFRSNTQTFYPLPGIRSELTQSKFRQQNLFNRPANGLTFTLRYFINR